MKPAAQEYAERFESFCDRTLYARLDKEEREAIRALAIAHRFTFQEFRQVAQGSRDLAMWGEPGVAEWSRERSGERAVGKESKKELLRALDQRLDGLRRRPTSYSLATAKRPAVRERKPVVTRKTDKKIYGMCPVASEQTVCCNLRTIDAVERCVFGCSYCAVQTFYHDDVAFDADFAAKLAAIELEPDRFYHFGTGQSSDALAWGNRGGNLDALCAFAQRNPNVLLELKTKSNNIRYFTDNRVPPNLVCSWSLNTPVVIANEEHFTADLENRLKAARAVADCGVRVAFHFHPMVHYEEWRSDYTALAADLMRRFRSDEVAFISFGSITMIKSAIKKLRELGNRTKINQVHFVPDPHGKLTYADDVKVDMFSAMYQALGDWHESVFFYLCMEKASIWLESFGYVYETNDAFEADFGRRTSFKV